MNIHKIKVQQVHVPSKDCDLCYIRDYGVNLSTGLSSFRTGVVKIYPYQKPSRKSFPSRNRRSHSSTSVLSYLMHAFSVSSINGVSNWAKSRKGIRKYLWFLVFIGCVGGYGYQTFTFYSRYMSSPTLVNILVENDGQVEFPAITICNANRFRRSAFCYLFPDNCTIEANNFTLSESKMADIVYDLLLEKRGAAKNQLGHSKDMIVSCDFAGYPLVSEKECKLMLNELYDPDFGNCYTIPAKNLDGLPLEAREGDFWQEANEMSILMDVEPDEYVETEREPGVFMVVHDESTQPDVHTDGLFLSPGRFYSIGVRKSTVLLLPLPYKMNCTDYFKLPWQKRYNRRLTSRLCTVGCSQYFQNRECKYVSKNLSLFYDILPYEKKDITREHTSCAEATEKRTLEYCRSICGLPCRDTVFSTMKESSFLSRKFLARYDLFLKELGSESILRSIVYAKVSFSSFEHKIYKHTPKYDTMELFSFFGGYSGVWLGFSLLTLYEILEIAVSTLVFGVCKLRHSRRNSTLHRIPPETVQPPLMTYKTKKRYG